MHHHPRRLARACFWLLLTVAGCDPALKREEQAYSQEATNVEIARDVEILYSDSAIVRVRITAPTLLYYIERENPRQEFPDGIKVEFLNPNLQVRSTLTSKSAIRQQEKGLVTIRDSVVLTTVLQEKLETEELLWDEKTEKVYTEKFVKVTKPGEVLFGFGLEANQDFSFWKITVPKGVIKAEQLDKALQ